MKEQWIDNAKAIGIALVVLGHMQLTPGSKNFIYSFHIPLFFLLSGYVHKAAVNLKFAFKKNITKLLLPYFYFYLISLAYNYIIEIKHHQYTFITHSRFRFIMGLFAGVGYSTNFSDSVNHPLWFLVALFVVRIIYLLLETLFKNNLYLIALTICILLSGIIYLKLNNIDLLFSIDSAILALPFYFFGVVMKKQYKRYHFFKYNVFNGFLFLLFAVSVYWLAKINGSADMNFPSWGNNIFLFYFIGLIGSLMVIALSFLFNKVSIAVINTIAGNTLIIMCLQGIIKSLLFLTSDILRHPLDNEVALIPQVVSTLAILALSLIPIYIINKYLPFLVGKERKKENADLLRQPA